MFVIKEELGEQDDEKEVGDLADNVLAYVRHHSDASDSLEGIREWWLKTEHRL